MSDRELYRLNREDTNQANLRLPLRALVHNVIPELEAVEAEMFTQPGTQRMTVLHPYMGVNSWLRVMPERGTPMLVQMRGDLPQPEISRYISNRLASVHERVEKGEDLLFRRLRQGELEIMSSGRAYTHWSDSGDLQMRGGVTRLDLSQTKLEISGWSPTFRRRLHLHQPTTLAHEERFGAVKRPDETNPNLVENYIRLDSGEFAVEYSRWMNSKEGKPLVSHQEGHVIDLQGQFIKHSSTNKTLRLYRRIHHRSQEGVLSQQIDEDLNVLITNTVGSSTITTLELGTNNTLKISTKEVKVEVSDSGNLSFANSVTIRSQQVNVATSNARFGNNPIFSSIIGERLIGQVMTPLLAQVASAFSALSLEPALTPASRLTLSSLGTSIGSLSSNASSALSQQVKLSG